MSSRDWPSADSGAAPGASGWLMRVSRIRALRMSDTCPSGAVSGARGVFSGARNLALGQQFGHISGQLFIALFLHHFRTFGHCSWRAFFREEAHPLLSIPKHSWRTLEASSSSSSPLLESFIIVAAVVFSIDVSCVASPGQTAWGFWLKFERKLQKR